jgi:hypothetical protein
MGDKSPRSKDKNKKQKQTSKTNKPVNKPGGSALLSKDKGR